MATISKSNIRKLNCTGKYQKVCKCDFHLQTLLLPSSVSLSRSPIKTLPLPLLLYQLLFPNHAQLYLHVCRYTSEWYSPSTLPVRPDTPTVQEKITVS